MRFYIEGGGRAVDFGRAISAFAEGYFYWRFLEELSEVEVSDQQAAFIYENVSDATFRSGRRRPLLGIGRPPRWSLNQRDARDVRRFFALARAVDPDDDLRLKSIRASSPGSIDLIGVGATLEQIRLYLADRAQRKDDAQYRSRLERERLELENIRLRTAAIREATELLQQLGFPDAEVKGFVSRLYTDGARALAQAQDLAAIGSETPPDARLTDNTDAGQ